MPRQVPRKDAAAVAFGFVLLLWSTAASPAGDDAAAKRGAYLYAVADCSACHTDTKNKGAPLAGGPPLRTPFGTFYGPNITPDPQDGIGGWSEAQFRRALRSGIDDDGDYLYPVFPFTSFTNLTDQDTSDLYAYLRTVKPVSRPSKDNDVTFPFNLRFLLVGWRQLFFREGPLPPAPGKSAEWVRGRYLAEAVAHCQECHTPRNFLGALDNSRAYAGNPNGPDKQDAPNITSDVSSAIARWSLAEVEQVLTDGQTPDFDFVGGGMAEVVKGTAVLTKADRHALAIYIKSLPPIHSEKREKKKKSEK